PFEFGHDAAAEGRAVGELEEGQEDVLEADEAEGGGLDRAVEVPGESAPGLSFALFGVGRALSLAGPGWERGDFEPDRLLDCAACCLERPDKADGAPWGVAPA